MPSGAQTISVTDSGDGLVRLMPTEAGFAERLRELVRQSGEMIDQRLRNAGIRDASVQPDGADRLRVLLPGVRDPERVSAMLGKRGRVTFRLVDVSVIAALALKGPLPPTSEILYHFKTREPSVVLKEIAMEGDDIIDASPLIDPRTQQPIASFRLNARGARRFATITQDNIGKPFAIVVDDQVLSESVISEPITGGSAIISGNFTIEDANNVAMLVRSGALPGRLSVVDQQVVEPVRDRRQTIGQLSQAASRRLPLSSSRPAATSASRIRAISGSLILTSGGRTTARGRRPRRTSASFMRLCMSTKGSA